MTQRIVPTIEHWNEAEIDFGANGTDFLEAVVVDSGISATNKIIVTQSLNQPTGKDQDEATMDDLIFKAWPAAGNFTLQVNSLTGPLHGKLKVFYNYA